MIRSVRSPRLLILSMGFAATVFLALAVLASCDPTRTATEPGDNAEPAPPGNPKALVPPYAEPARPAPGPADVALRPPPGFVVEVWAQGLPGAFDLSRPDGLGNRWLSRPEQGVVTLLESDADGRTARATDVLTGLDRPTALAVEPTRGMELYVAAADGLHRARLHTDAALEKVVEWPEGLAPRGLLFGPDLRLYVSLAASRDIDPSGSAGPSGRQSGVWVLDEQAGNLVPFATGLSGPGFMAMEPVFGDIWATEQGRADPSQPDEVVVLRQDMRGQPAKVVLEAGFEPLGLDFVPEEGWPEEYRLDLLVASAVGFEPGGADDTSGPGKPGPGSETRMATLVERVRLSDDRQILGREPFLEGQAPWGGPADIQLAPGGVMFLTHPGLGAVYRVIWKGLPAKRELADLIRVEAPKLGASIESPLTVRGEARGMWYFEASFPVRLLDGNGRMLAEAPASARGEWMTEEFVPFEANLSFAKPHTTSGTLVLRRANASGLPEHDLELRMPVRFSRN